MSKKKTNITVVRSALQSSGVAAAAIVLLCISLGAVIVPGIFADAAATTPSISNVKASPSNDRNYSVTLTWDGVTRDHWKGETNWLSTNTDTWTSNSKQKTFSGLRCDTLYSFKVAAAGPNGGAQSDYKSAYAVTKCPSAAWVTYSSSGNKINMRWKDGAGFSEKYTIYIAKNNSGSFVPQITTTNLSYTLNGECGTTYSAKITAFANNQYGPFTGTSTARTDPCPVLPDTPDPPNNGGGGGGSTPPGGGGGGGSTTPGGGGSGSTGSGTGSSGGSGGTTRSSSSGDSSSIPLTTELGVPENLSAEVISHKIVSLSWDAAANADHYIVNRSIDNISWQQIASTELTTYNDESANFSTTYYYQVQAVGADGQTSDAALTQVTTEGFVSSSDTISSQDKLVTAKIPDGAIEGDYSCTISSTDTEGTTLPKNQNPILGPYDLLCVTSEGDVVGKFEKAVPITMKLSSVAGGYTNLNVRTLSEGNWKTVKSSYDQNKQVMSFTLTSARSFATFAEKKSSPWGTVITVFFILLLIGGAVFSFLWWRRRRPGNYEVTSVGSQNASAEQEFQQALAQPDCSHLDMAQQVIPSGQGCYECEQQGTQWKALRICLICGHVGCSDDSGEQHALKHFQETGHPIIYEYGNPAGNSMGWCYIDQTYI